jgi:hypothetical protein
VDTSADGTTWSGGEVVADADAGTLRELVPARFLRVVVDVAAGVAWATDVELFTSTGVRLT